MGDMADDIIAGVFCQECGAYIGEEVGYPRSCDDCSPDISEPTDSPTKKEQYNERKTITEVWTGTQDMH